MVLEENPVFRWKYEEKPFSQNISFIDGKFMVRRLHRFSVAVLLIYFGVLGLAILLLMKEARPWVDR
jgi:hypothetical protein